jgi:glutamate dehydrogenase/leucine dehydrogenase
MFETDHEGIFYCNDPKAGLRAIIAIHSTHLGPALGGTRIFPYRNEEEALQDVLSLSRAMTYKAAAADLPFGGGKAVILADPTDPEKQKKLKAFCRYVNMLGGAFQTGEDLGTTQEDILYMRQFTNLAHCTTAGLPDWMETSALTARGVLRGIEASLEHSFGSADLNERTIAIQGLGKVGLRLARLLKEKRARLIVTDMNADLAAKTATELNCLQVDPLAILVADADVFCPCAIGRILNSESIERLRAPIVAGCANNQLSEDSIAERLRQRGVLYAPDYVINAGGLISALLEMGLENETDVLSRVDAIRNRLLDLFAKSDTEECSTLQIADRIVKRKIGISVTTGSDPMV